jgi:hypothetical protein
MAKGQLAKRLKLNSRMGLDRGDRFLREPLDEWPGPGQAFTGFGEYNQRALLALWGEYMLGRDPVGNGAVAPAAVGVAPAR